MKVSAKCIQVEGNQEEFSDLIGSIGKLRLDPVSKDPAVNWFTGGNTVNFVRKKVVVKDGIVKVFTRVGNCFTFRLENNSTM